ncbi:MAG: CpXC domain-containing protein, partial [Anaerolineae bacterium]|nr:CpXC domain-containing protein [Anaerolineae bacterium]
MNVSPTQIRANCPACGALVSAEVRRLIDVGQEPDLKRRLLRGQLNVAVCPNCSARVTVATPLAYHDPQKELLLTLIPGQMGLAATEQDKTIGELTNLVMNSLPAEQRKAYLFQPKTFFSMDSLLSEILRADGITDEMMEKQKQRAQLMQDLLSFPDDEAGFGKLVEEKTDSLDYEFFLFLSASIDQARKEGEDDLVRELSGLRDRLSALLSPTGAPPPESLKGALTREEL